MTATESMQPRAPLSATLPYAEHRQRLLEERSFRVEQLAALDAETPVSPCLESVTRALHLSATAALTEIDAALARLADGCFGRCVTCERQIDAERLAVLPMASLCMSCHYHEQNCHLGTVEDG